MVSKSNSHFHVYAFQDNLNWIIDVTVIRESELSSDRTTGTNGHCSALLGFKCQAHTLNLLLDVIL